MPFLIKGRNDIQMKQIFNPYLPSYEYIPDGEPHIFGERLYIYGSHDRFGGEDYCVNDYVCWSAPLEDLSNWKFEGTIYRKTQHPYSVGRNILFAPDVVQGKDGRYYLYYSVADSAIMSVAVCDTPAGSYQYYGDVRDRNGHVAGSSSGDFFQFDPGVFLDEDGRIFLFSGFCPGRLEDAQGRKFVGCHMCELEDDMITIKRGPEIILDRNTPCPEEQRYFEAPSLRKFHGRYYLIYSVRIGGLHYYISDRPDGGYRYGGRIHSTSDVGINGHSVENPAYPNGNTHGSLIEIQGNYYIFDHRLTNHSSYCRQGVAEQVWIEEDGRILQVEATSCGLNRGPLLGIGSYPAYIACTLIDQNQYISKEEQKKRGICITQEGEDRECEPGQFIQSIQENCLIGYKYFSFIENTKVTFTVRGNAEGKIQIRTTETGKIEAELVLYICSKEWKKVTGEFFVRREKSGFYLAFVGRGSFDLLTIEFEK